MLPNEITAQLNTKFQCREQQIQHLAALYQAHLPSPFLNVHGLIATGKSAILRSYFHLSNIPHTIINVRECITTRHLLERIVAASLDALDQLEDDKIDRRPYARTENLSALCVNLGKILHGRGRFVIVLDAVDKLREGGGALIAALARLGEAIPNLSLILTTTLALTPSILHTASASFLHFTPYTRSELLAILGKDAPQIFETIPSLEDFPDYTTDLAAEDDAWLWGRFLQAVYDSLSKHTGRDLVSFKRCALRLWRPFVEPITSGQFGTRDFSRLMVNRRHLFQVEDSVLDRIIKPSSASSASQASSISTRPAKLTPPNLPYYTTHLLIAAYLASYNPSRTDVTYFSKHTDKRKAPRRGPHNTSLGTTTTPGKRSTAGGGGGAVTTRHRKISRHLLTPSPFALDRLFAIFRALVGAETAVGQLADLYTQVTTAVSLKLLVRAGLVGAGGGAGDVLEAGAKWRVNFSWEYARALGRSVGIEVGEFLVGGVE